MAVCETVKRNNFFERARCSDTPDEWETTYNASFVRGYKPPTQKFDNYQSPYGQRSKRSLKAQAQEEKRERLVTLQRPSIISESLLPELSKLCALYAPGGAEEARSSLETRNRCVPCCPRCIEDHLPYSIVLHEQIKQQAAEYTGEPGKGGQCSVCDLLPPKNFTIYSKDMPTIPRPPLPRDISQPSFVQLQAKNWKGVPYPFADPRFDPFIPACVDASIVPSTLNPFKYCQRKRTFPQFNRTTKSSENVRRTTVQQEAKITMDFDTVRDILALASSRDAWTAMNSALRAACGTNGPN